MGANTAFSGFGETPTGELDMKFCVRFQKRWQVYATYPTYAFTPACSPASTPVFTAT